MTEAHKPHSVADAISTLVGDIRAAMWEGSGHRHWDSTRKHGAGCEMCIAQREGRDKIDRALTQIIARHSDLEEQLETLRASVEIIQTERDELKRQADLDAERASILSAAVGRARLVLNDASRETTELIHAALDAMPDLESKVPMTREELDAAIAAHEASSPAMRQEGA